MSIKQFTFDKGGVGGTQYPNDNWESTLQEVKNINLDLSAMKAGATEFRLLAVGDEENGNGQFDAYRSEALHGAPEASIGIVTAKNMAIDNINAQTVVFTNHLRGVKQSGLTIIQNALGEALSAIGDAKRKREARFNLMRAGFEMTE